jgi:hypothetical protein
MFSAGSLHEGELCGVFVNHCRLHKGSEETGNINGTVMMMIPLRILKR